MWNETCEYGLPAPSSLEVITGLDGLEYYHNDINLHLKQLVENLLLSKCGYPDFQIMVALFDRISALPLADYRKSGFHSLYSDLFVYYGQLDLALIQLRYAFDLSPSPRIPIRQAMLSASAGNYADALVFLERARSADREQSFLLPPFEQEIYRMESDIKLQLISRQ